MRQRTNVVVQPLSLWRSRFIADDAVRAADIFWNDGFWTLLAEIHEAPPPRCK